MQLYSEDSDDTPLQEAGEHVAPVMFVVGHAGQTHVHRRRDQEELDGRAQEPRPLRLEPGVNVQLKGRKHPPEKMNKGLTKKPP